MSGNQWARWGEARRGGERAGAQRNSRWQWSFAAGRRNATSTLTLRLNGEVDALKGTTVALWISWSEQ